MTVTTPLPTCPKNKGRTSCSSVNTPKPGRWLQFDWGEGPHIGRRRTWLFCAWLSWSRFRVVIPVWDCTLDTLVACLDTTLRRIGGAPIHVLTGNAKTVTVERIAGIPVRHPQMIAAGRHYGCQVVSCVPYDPESKGGAEATVRIAMAGLVPTDANLLPAYDTFAGLAEACRTWCEQVNSRRHRATGQIPADRLDILPIEPLALGEGRLVGSDRTISCNSVRYSTPSGYIGVRVWCRVVGEELSITARTNLVNFSKGTDLDCYSREELDAVAANSQPRRTRGWETQSSASLSSWPQPPGSFAGSVMHTDGGAQPRNGFVLAARTGLRLPEPQLLPEFPRTCRPRHRLRPSGAPAGFQVRTPVGRSGGASRRLDAKGSPRTRRR
ncbi:hypothetical protein ACFXKG_32865 [Streptomyces sp. NPDC059255]|uniref:hypothetical protein n=1 Tax=Streptomyces sp. NPDC059255 TaxID=3346793 RepID=UPI0036BDB10C